MGSDSEEEEKEHDLDDELEALVERLDERACSDSGLPDIAHSSFSGDLIDVQRGHLAAFKAWCAKYLHVRAWIAEEDDD